MVALYMDSIKLKSCNPIYKKNAIATVTTAKKFFVSLSENKITANTLNFKMYNVEH